MGSQGSEVGVEWEANGTKKVTSLHSLKSGN